MRGSTGGVGGQQGQKVVHIDITVTIEVLGATRAAAAVGTDQLHQVIDINVAVDVLVSFSFSLVRL